MNGTPAGRLVKRGQRLLVYSKHRGPEVKLPAEARQVVREEVWNPKWKNRKEKQNSDDRPGSRKQRLKKSGLANR